MVTIQQLHVILNNHLQELNSNVFQDLPSEVKDMFLYEELLEFIRDNSEELSNRLQEGFEDTQKRYDNLKPFKTTTTLPLFKRTSNSVYGVLPYNYMNRIKVDVEVFNNCNVTTINTTTTTYYKVAIPIKDDTQTPLYNGFKVIDATNVENLFEASDHYAPGIGLNSVKEKFLLIQLMLEELKSSNGLEFYWEWYNGEFKSQHLWVVGTSPIDVKVEYTNVALTQTYTLAAEETTRTIYDLSSETNTKIYPSRLVRSEFLTNKLNSKFSKTFFYSPIIELEMDTIIIYHENSFIPKTVQLQYLRFPRVPYLSLNRNIEVSKSVADLIAKKAAQRIAATRGMTTYQGIARENMFNE